MLELGNIKLHIPVGDEVAALGKAVSGIIGAPCRNITIVKRSLDARKKPELYYVYTCAFDCDIPLKTLEKRHIKDIREYLVKRIEIIKPLITEMNHFRPVIIGSGPAGMFAGLYLAKAGLRPIIIERGSCVEERTEKVSEFWKTGILDVNTNVQFGEGGAGTFSDGKLNTGIKDRYGYIRTVLETLVEYGASPEILYSNKPHIGTDVLAEVVMRIREAITSLGGTYRFNTVMTDFEYKDNRLTGVILNSGEVLPTDCCILAIGHSSRDTYEMLHRKGVSMANKPFAMGIRIQHPQTDINISQYGTADASLPAADYKVTYNAPDGRGVYSFCMCPGGYVVNASSEQGRLCVNGMSYSRRDSGVANSAIVMTIDEKDYGTGILDGMYYQRMWEEHAYSLGGGRLVLQRYADFKVNASSSREEETFEPRVKGLYCYGNVRSIVPESFADHFMDAMEAYGHSISNFDNGDALICGVEARTSSPVRILRDEEYNSSVKGIYPCGEGAGYAGGITSAAVDGLKVAESICRKLAGPSNAE